MKCFLVNDTQKDGTRGQASRATAGALQDAVVQEAGVQGVQAHPQKFWFVENLGKIPKNLGKTSKNPGEIPENLGKNGAQRCLT